MRHWTRPCQRRNRCRKKPRSTSTFLPNSSRTSYLQWPRSACPRSSLHKSRGRPRRKFRSNRLCTRWNQRRQRISSQQCNWSSWTDRRRCCSSHRDTLYRTSCRRSCNYQRGSQCTPGSPWKERTCLLHTERKQWPQTRRAYPRHKRCTGRIQWKRSRRQHKIRTTCRAMRRRPGPSTFLPRMNYRRPGRQSRCAYRRRIRCRSSCRLTASASQQRSRRTRPCLTFQRRYQRRIRRTR